MQFICQSKSPIWTDKWLKGFQNLLTCVKDIGNQSWGTNCGTPCISKRVEAADETSILRGLGEEDSVHEVILDLSLAPEKSGLLLHPGSWVQVKLQNAVRGDTHMTSS